MCLRLHTDCQVMQALANASVLLFVLKVVNLARTVHDVLNRDAHEYWEVLSIESS